MPREHSSSEEAPAEPGWHVTGSNEEVQQLQEALTRLGGDTEVGFSISETMRAQGTTTRFGQIGEDAIAYFAPALNEIVIDDSVQNASSEILAAHLAHEGTHVQWEEANSVDQEYHAFRAQAEIWN